MQVDFRDRLLQIFSKGLEYDEWGQSVEAIQRYNDVVRRIRSSGSFTSDEQVVYINLAHLITARVTLLTSPSSSQPIDLDDMRYLKATFEQLCNVSRERASSSSSPRRSRRRRRKIAIRYTTNCEQILESISSTLSTPASPMTPSSATVSRILATDFSDGDEHNESPDDMDSPSSPSSSTTTSLPTPTHQPISPRPSLLRRLFGRKTPTLIEPPTLPPLLPPLSHPRSGDSILTIIIRKVGLKDASRYIHPHIHVVVANGFGEPIEEPQCTPYARPEGRRERFHIGFNDCPIHIQTPLSDLIESSDGSTDDERSIRRIFFEVRHVKPKYSRVSVRCWTLLEMSDIKAGRVALELYRKPTEWQVRRFRLFSVKQLFLQLELKILRY